jgi:ATP-dependent DNA ligase
LSRLFSRVGRRRDARTLDGEAVVVGPDGLTDFEALRRRGAGDVAVLYAFDLMELDGDDLRSLPIETRKATLASLLRNPGAIRLPTLRPVAHGSRRNKTPSSLAAFERTALGVAEVVRRSPFYV